MLKEKPRKSQNNGIFAGRKSQTRVRGLFNNRTGVFLCQGSRPQTASMSCKPVLLEKSLTEMWGFFFGLLLFHSVRFQNQVTRAFPVFYVSENFLSDRKRTYMD